LALFITGSENYHANEDRRDCRRHLLTFHFRTGNCSTGGFTFNRFLVLGDKPLP